MTKPGRIHLEKLARIDSRLAELHSQEAGLLSERAQVLQAMAAGELRLHDGRKEPARHEPTLLAVSPLDQARARKVLNDRARDRRVTR